jgi:CRISPR/Cas system CSM-associated protein Csm3 (group 7 of RAMP superfamily)
MREWCQARFDVEKLWGFQRDDRGAASRLVVDDVTLPQGVEVEVRDGVGIDRSSGVAKARLKFDRAVLPVGSRLRLRLEVELPDDDEEEGAARAQLGALLAALEAGEVRLGAAQTRGLGRVRLEETAIREQRLDTRAGLLELLAAGSADEVGCTRTVDDLVAQGPGPKPGARSTLEVTVVWRPLGPLMVKSGADGLAIDSLPLVSRSGGGLSLLLPGSALKGALRTRAEQIVRTVLDFALADDQLDVPLVKWLFGAAGRSARARGAPRTGLVERGGLVSGRGALRVEDCHARVTFDADAWKAVTRAKNDGEARQAIDGAGLGDWAHAYHVAVDRWTGGAAQGLLYSTLEPHDVEWEPIRLSIDFARLPHDLVHAAVALLLLLLDELGSGRLPLGYGVNRGHGDVEVSSVSLSGEPQWLTAASGGPELVLGPSVLADLPEAVRTKLTSPPWYENLADPSAAGQ